MNNLSMYNSVEEDSSDKKEKNIVDFKLKGAATNNIVLELDSQQLDLASYKFVSQLASELKQLHAKIKKLEAANTKLNYENYKLRTDVNTLKQILNK